MWITVKKSERGESEFIRPDRIEKIEYVGHIGGQGTGPTFRFYIDGRRFVSDSKIGRYVGYGTTVLCEENVVGKSYCCDDSVIISAVARYFFTGQYAELKQIPALRAGDLLPLFSRTMAREYLKIHQIPHPGKWSPLKIYEKYKDFQPSAEEFAEDFKRQLVDNPLGLEDFLKTASMFRPRKIRTLSVQDITFFIDKIMTMSPLERSTAVKVFSKHVYGKTPLRSAILVYENSGKSLLSQAESGELCEFLLCNGANPNAVIKDSYPEPNMPLLAVLAYGMRTERMKFLLEHGADPNQGLEGGVRPLDMACYMRRGYASVRLLLKYGANPLFCKNQALVRDTLAKMAEVMAE